MAPILALLGDVLIMPLSGHTQRSQNNVCDSAGINVMTSNFVKAPEPYTQSLVSMY